MTWYIFMKKYDPDLSDYECEKILWEGSSYPFGHIKMICRQILSDIRAKKNNIERCELCFNKIPYHSKGCLRK